jgi:hypothetical protein
MDVLFSAKNPEIRDLVCQNQGAKIGKCSRMDDGMKCLCRKVDELNFWENDLAKAE